MQADPLLSALEDLAAIAGRDAVDALRVRLREQRLRVLVAGEAKRGKSTLVNALLGQAVLPAGVTPLTALATTVRYGTDERVTATLPGGRVAEFPVSALRELVTERANPGNARNVSSVTVSVGAPLLARGVELVDTPGTGSVFGHGTAEAEAALQAMDVAVFVLTADPPVSASERELMSQVARLSVAMFVVLNKADHLSGGELAEVVDFTSEVAALALLDERLTEALRAELDAVRQAAADLLGLDLAVAAPVQRLAPDARFFYQVTGQAGQTELFAGMIRRHMPGKAGRARAREHVLSEAATVVPQQIGRARADLQYRLAEATRRLVRVVDERYQEATGRLERALADAAELAGATAERIAAHEQQMASRLAAIDHVQAVLDAASQLDEAGQGSPAVPVS